MAALVTGNFAEISAYSLTVFKLTELAAAEEAVADETDAVLFEREADLNDYIF